MELHRRIALARAHRQPERPRLGIPIGALEDAGLPLEPEPVRLGDVLGARREDVEHEGAAGLQEHPGRAQSLQLLLLVRHVEQRAEGADHELHALRHGRLTQVADPEVEKIADALLLRERASDTEHAHGEVDADHLPPRGGDRHRDAARSHRKLDHRPLDALRFLDVEGDVLHDRRAPRVVDGRDRVVERHGASVRSRW